MGKGSTSRFHLGVAIRTVALAALALPACMFFTSAGEGKALRRDVDALKSNVETRQAELSETVKKAEAELAKVEAATAEATKLLTRNSADVGAQVLDVRATLEKVEGQLAEASAAIEALRKEMGEYRAQTDVKLEALGNPASKSQAAPVPEDKQQLYAQAEEKLQAGHYEDARRLLRTYLNRFGSDDQADNAQLMLGESYFREEKFAAAIGEFQKVIDNFPKGDSVDDAFFKNGQAFFKLKYCTDGRVFLQELIRRFPRSSLLAEARKLLDEIDKAKKNRSKCTS